MLHSAAEMFTPSAVRWKRNRIVCSGTAETASWKNWKIDKSRRGLGNYSARNSPWTAFPRNFLCISHWIIIAHRIRWVACLETWKIPFARRFRSGLFACCVDQPSRHNVDTRRTKRNIPSLHNFSSHGKAPDEIMKHVARPKLGWRELISWFAAQTETFSDNYT